MQKNERDIFWRDIGYTIAEDDDEIMYIVHNTTSRTVMLSDLHAEIKPMAIIDLEKIAYRDAIDRSRDLRHALKTGRLQLGRHSVVRTREISDDFLNHARQVEINQTSSIDEEKLARIVRQVVSEEMSKGSTKQTPSDNNDLEDIKNSVGDLLSQIRDRINSPEKSEERMNIDPEKFAEWSQKSVEKISEEIQTGGSNKHKKVQIINENLRDLADEL